MSDLFDKQLEDDIADLEQENSVLSKINEDNELILDRMREEASELREGLRKVQSKSSNGTIRVPLGAWDNQFGVMEPSRKHIPSTQPCPMFTISSDDLIREHFRAQECIEFLFKSSTHGLPPQFKGRSLRHMHNHYGLNLMAARVPYPASCPHVNPRYEEYRPVPTKEYYA